MWPEPRETPNLTFQEVQGGERIACGRMTLAPFPVRHAQWFKSVGYRVEASGKSFAYTGDLGPDQDYEQFESALEGIDLLIIEAAALGSETTHLTPEQALALGRNAGASRIIFTHLDEGRLQEARKLVSKHPDVLTIAEDRMEIVL